MVPHSGTIRPVHTFPRSEEEPCQSEVSATTEKRIQLLASKETRGGTLPLVWRLPEQESEWTDQTRKKRKANPNRLALKETLEALQCQELWWSIQDILMVMQYKEGQTGTKDLMKRPQIQEEASHRETKQEKIQWCRGLGPEKEQAWLMKTGEIVTGDITRATSRNAGYEGD